MDARDKVVGDLFVENEVEVDPLEERVLPARKLKSVPRNNIWKSRIWTKKER